jgi:hypothetical protein
MTQFRDNFYSLVPPWLATGNAERYFYTLELMRDLLMEKCNQAIKIRLPGQGDASQIPYLAFDRQLLQGPLESDASFITRLQNAFPTWAEAGSAPAVLGQLQAYAQGYQSVDLPQFAIVSNPRLRAAATYVNTWYTLNYSDPIGTEPLLSTVPQNFDWDGLPHVWRNWLVIYQYLDPPTLSGAAASITAAGGGSFTDPGHNVDGVWVPRTSGTPINAPFLTVHGLAGLSPANRGNVITFSGSANPDNNGTFQIVRVLTATSCVVVNVAGAVDAGPLTWEIAAFPWMPPALALGTIGVWGEGEGAPPPVDTGSNVRGVWQPTETGGAGQLPSYSWGVRVNSLEIQTIRELVRTWKGASTYYPNIIIAYDGPNGDYSRTSTGAGNPDGTFGSVGKLVDGVWVPTRGLGSAWDCYCQGTGIANACSEENIT